MKFYIDNLKRLNDVLNEEAGFGIWLWSERAGSGKSSLAKADRDSSEKIVYCSPLTFAALEKQFHCKAIFKKHVSDYAHILKGFVRFVARKDIKRLYFDAESGVAQTGYYEIIAKCIYGAVQKGIRLKAIFVFDNKDERNKAEQIFQDIFAERNIHNLDLGLKWCAEDLEALFHELFPNIILEPNVLQTIISYSAENAGLFLHQFFSLKNEGLLEKEETGLLSARSDLVPFLEYKYADNIQSRYSRLEPSGQNLLQKTSIIGQEFPVRMLSKAFSVSDALIVLKKIQTASRLVEFTDRSFENGKFESESVRTYLKNLIPVSEYRECCRQLDNYYASQSRYEKLTVDDEIALYKKRAFYMGEAGERDLALVFSLTAMGLMYSQHLYSSGVQYAKFVAQKADEYSQQMRETLYYFLYESCNKIMGFDDAFYYFCQYRKPFQCKTFDDRYKLGELYYNIGKAERSKEILFDLLNDEDLYQKASTWQKAELLNFISSLEESMDIAAYIDHYEQALSFAQQSSRGYLYYKILRKANFCYHNSKGIELLEEAKKYFERIDLIEYAKCCHNIATEQLLTSKTLHKKARNNLDRALETMESTGCLLSVYPYNSLAIYYIFQGEYEKAIRYIEPQLQFCNDDFLTLAIYVNLITCYRKIGIKERALELLQTAEICHQNQNEIYPFFTNCLLLQKMMFSLEEKDIPSAKKLLNKLEDTAKGYFLLDVAKCALGQKGTYGDVAEECARQKLVVADLMFWE